MSTDVPGSARWAATNPRPSWGSRRGPGPRARRPVHVSYSEGFGRNVEGRRAPRTCRPSDSGDGLPAGLGERIDWHDDTLDEGPFRFAHEPESATGRYTIAGHLHPTRRLVLAGDRVRAPAFWFRADSAVLPAFGGFTGGMNISPAAGDRVFVTGPGAVVEVSQR